MSEYAVSIAYACPIFLLLETHVMFWYFPTIYRKDLFIRPSSMTIIDFIGYLFIVKNELKVFYSKSYLLALVNIAVTY